ncbi:MAG: amino acid permease [Trueperaceae bacterium]|nr:amino acid permease [Trueperaceae bacterium]
MTNKRLQRELGLFGAVMLGLGSIIGTGVFVSIGIAAGVTGKAVIFAVILAALVALCNGLSSAQLAADHAVSGGTYEYGYRFLKPMFGFLAGWMFLLAKSASAATAALGFAGYFLSLFGISAGGFTIVIALGAVLVLTLTVISGLKRSNLSNTIMVAISVLSLGLLILWGLPRSISASQSVFTLSSSLDWSAFFYASALMFVAYTGYGRIATLGEEVKNPETTIPKAMITTLVVTMILYGLVAFVAVSLLGAGPLAAASKTAAPLEAVARTLNFPFLPQILALGAMTAMLGVLLNLLLGLSRVLLAMGRRGDMPRLFARLNQAGTSPTPAVIAVATVIAALVLIGNVKLTWSFSAFTVLVYYSITNLAALRIAKEKRLFPSWVSWLGLLSCLTLAVFVEARVLVWGLVSIAAILLLFFVLQRSR